MEEILSKSEIAELGVQLGKLGYPYHTNPERSYAKYHSIRVIALVLGITQSKIEDAVKNNRIRSHCCAVFNHAYYYRYNIDDVENVVGRDKDWEMDLVKAIEVCKRNRSEVIIIPRKVK
jgi:hypothetical protein